MIDKIGKKINLLGDNFKGLRNSKILDAEGKIGKLRWTVTYLHKGDIVETPACNTAEIALDIVLYRRKYDR